MTTDNYLSSWQEWLDTASRLFSFDNWEKINNALGVSDIPVENIEPVQFSSVILAYTSSTYLACVKEQDAEVGQALQSIHRHMTTIRPEAPRRKAKPSVRKAYINYMKELASVLSDSGDLLYATFTAYWQDDYDMQSDPNLLIRAAIHKLENNKRDEALHAFSQAMAIAMRCGKIWSGWHTNVFDTGGHWFTLLTLVLTIFPLIPLGSVAEERLLVNERLAKLRYGGSGDLSDEEIADALSLLEIAPAEDTAAVDEEALMQQWSNLVTRQDPLTDKEIEEMGDGYAQSVGQAIDILDTVSEAQDSDETSINSIMFFAHGLGVLRYQQDDSAANALINVLPIIDDSPEILDEISWALEQMGSTATQALMDFVRYTTDEYILEICSNMLARVGRGDEDVYRFLIERYKEEHSIEEQIILINALGLLHDQRILPLLVQALHDLAADEDGVAAVLDALKEIGAPVTIDAVAGSVTIDGYGQFDNIVPHWWAPEEAGEEKDEDGILDLDQLFADDEEEEDDGEFFVEDDQESQKPPPPTNRAGFGPVRVEHIGRNDPCPCGSGKKYKHCHGKNV
jgi:hypothetical protein